MLIQVFQLTPEQINALPADQRAGVHQLVSLQAIVYTCIERADVCNSVHNSGLYEMMLVES